MKKICFFMATPFTLGGEQRVVTIISNLLVKKGYDVTILCTDEKTKINYNIYKMNRRVQIKYINGYNSKLMKRIQRRRQKMYIDNLENGTYKDNLKVQKFINCDIITELLLIKSFNEGKYDVIISLATEYNTMLARVSKKIKAKTIGWQHGCSDLYFDTKGLRHFNQDIYTYYMLASLDEYVVLTDYDKNYIKRKFNREVTVINNPKSIVSDKTSELNNKVFLAIGRFTKIKNFTSLIDMFNKFHTTNDKWKLYIVGDGELKEEYIKTIEKYNLQNYVKIFDRTDNVENYYLEASIYLMSSILEGWGMVIGEAIEFGLPVISFDIPSATEFIESGYNGYIVKKYDNEEYVKRMLELANNPELIKKMGKNSKKISLKKTNDIVIDKWEMLLNR